MGTYGDTETWVGPASPTALHVGTTSSAPWPWESVTGLGKAPEAWAVFC